MKIHWTHSMFTVWHCSKDLAWFEFQIKEDTIIRTDKLVYTLDDAEVLLQLFKSAYFNLFGELFYDEFDETAHDPSACKNTLSSENGEKCSDYVSQWHYGEIAMTSH